MKEYKKLFTIIIAIIIMIFGVTLYQEHIDYQREITRKTKLDECDYACKVTQFTSPVSTTYFDMTVVNKRDTNRNR